MDGRTLNRIEPWRERRTAVAEYIFQIVGDCFDDKYISRADCARANKSRCTVNKSQPGRAEVVSLVGNTGRVSRVAEAPTRWMEIYVQIFTSRIKGSEKHTFFAGDLSKNIVGMDFRINILHVRGNVCIRAMSVFSLKNLFANTPDGYVRVLSVCFLFFKKIKYCMKIKYRFACI